MRHYAQGFEPLSQLSKALRRSRVHRAAKITRSRRRSVMTTPFQLAVSSYQLAVGQLFTVYCSLFTKTPKGVL